jgi:hypothetical protein
LDFTRLIYPNGGGGQCQTSGAFLKSSRRREEAPNSSGVLWESRIFEPPSVGGYGIEEFSNARQAMSGRALKLFLVSAAIALAAERRRACG